MTLTLPEDRKSHLPAIITVFLIISLGVGGVFGWQYWQQIKATQNPNATISKTPVTTSTAPDETPLDEQCDAYDVPENMPRKLYVDAFNMNICIEPVGRDQNNAIALPTNIHLAGYYVKSTKPGKQGTTVINGHSVGRYNHPIFSELDQLKRGQEIQIQIDEVWLHYEIIDIHTYSLERVHEHLFDSIEFDRSDKIKNQITLAGYSNTDDEADQATIVHAKLK